MGLALFAEAKHSGLSKVAEVMTQDGLSVCVVWRYTGPSWRRIIVDERT